MKEWEVLEKVKSFLVDHINSNVEAIAGLTIDTISADNILIDYPDTDSMKNNVMFYIVPENEDFTYLTLSSDLASMYATIYILVKRDNQQNLIKKAFSYFSAMYQTIREEPSLGGEVDEATFETMEFYPAVEANKSIVGIETKILIKYAKEF